MGAITIRNLSEEVHRALRMRAAKHGRSTEAEVREILEAAVCAEGRLKIGSELAAFGRQWGGVELVESRDSAPAEPATFE